MHPFRKLLLVSMGRDSSYEKDPSPGDWVRLFSMARHQTLIGVLNDGVHRLPESQLPPQQMLEEWDHLTGKIASIYARHERRVAALEDIFERKGLRGCVLKGTGLAQLYPTPERRQCGDIDVWVPGPRRAILEAFSDDYDVHDVVYQECKVDIFKDTDVEVHFHPAKMFNPVLNARLQRWLKKNSPLREGAHSIPVSDKGVLCYPDTEFNAVYCMAHMFRHYIVGGLGMRQMMDYNYVLKALPAARRGPVMQTLKRLGLGRFAAACMLSLQYNFGLEDEYLLCRPDRKRGAILINDSFKTGNFGVLDSRNRASKDESAFGRFRRKNRRTLSYLRLYPREIAWAPLARISQYLWRRLQGFI